MVERRHVHQFRFTCAIRSAAVLHHVQRQGLLFRQQRPLPPSLPATCLGGDAETGVGSLDQPVTLQFRQGRGHVEIELSPSVWSLSIPSVKRAELDPLLVQAGEELDRLEHRAAQSV